MKVYPWQTTGGKDGRFDEFNNMKVYPWRARETTGGKDGRLDEFKVAASDINVRARLLFFTMYSASMTMLYASMITYICTCCF